MKNYYKILEIADFSDSSDIRRAYKTLSKRYHPDVNPHYPLADEMFKRINEAYAVLSDPVRKAAFDQRLGQENGVGAAPSGADEDGLGPSAAEATGFYSNAAMFTDGSRVSTFVFTGNDGSNLGGEPLRLSLFQKIIYICDIVFGIYLVIYCLTLDISMVPKVYRVAGHSSWLVHFDVAIITQVLTALFSLFQLLRAAKGRHSTVHVLAKLFASYHYVAPMFGATLFDISGKVLFAGFLWNAFMGLALIVLWIMQEERKMLF